MNKVTSAQFDEFFESVYGYGPFPWQAELARRAAEAQLGDPCWPKALALPTAAGKTACIDMAIFALACQSDRASGKRTAPRRIFFVVDRRVIVDETFERARNLAQKLQDARKGTDGILKDVADSLCSLTRGDAEDDPLAFFQLRGGMYRDDAWARSPLQPTVVVTTVDQFASRLLFRGYGSSTGMRPIHAGLAANDCLVLLDEAHCANPFRQTVTSVKRYRDWALQPGSLGSAPFHLTLISATPPQDIADADRLTAGEEDREHAVLGGRIKASKPARLMVARNRRDSEASTQQDDAPEQSNVGTDGGGRQPESERRRRERERLALERLAEVISDEAVKLVSEEHRAIGIMVNRVAMARRVYEHLRGAGKDVTLLTGRMRAIDRDNVVHDLESLKTGASREDRTRFIVATQTLEVGADLDFDGLVTECASLDALRQRFGRLNRGGRNKFKARATIVVRADQTNPKTSDDPVYGTALAETWQWLNEKASKDGIDFGYAAMDGIMPGGEELEKMNQQAADAPVMLPAHVDAWVQTSPAPSPDPDVALFLHGPNRGAPEVQVCWRADLQPDTPQEQQVEIVSLCPPASSECISVPIHILRRWLGGMGIDARYADSDVEGTILPSEESSRERRGIQLRVLCWRGPDESRLLATHSDLQDLRPGDTVVIPAELKGWDVFGHIPADSDGNQVIDLGDRAYLQSRAKAVLRIHTKVVESWPDCPARSRFMALAEWSEDAEDAMDEAEIRQSLEALAETDALPKLLKDAASALARDRRRKKLPHPGGGFVLQGSHRIPEYTGAASTLTSEDDSYSATVRVTLDCHLEGVERWARSFGEGVGLPDELVDDLALAAHLHDVGKADPRFQAMLHGGHRWASSVSGILLAKSGNLPTSKAENRRAHNESGYPPGARHELLSVRLIESVPVLLESAHDQDLVLHLVASHHGHCRPFAPVVNDTEPVDVYDTILDYQMSANSATGLERLDSGVPERFWRLVRRYGWWGMAWLEALLRLADHHRSGEEQKPHKDADN